MRTDNHNSIYGAFSRNHGRTACLRSLGLAGLLAASVPAAAGAQSPTMAARNALAAKSDAFVSARLRQSLPAKPGRPAPPAKCQAIWGAKGPDTGVIIRTNGFMTPKQEQQLQAVGASVYRHLPFIQSVAARVSMRDLPRIASLPFVARISADAAIRKCDEFTVGSSGADMAMQQYGVTGSGVTVAVVDSGVYGQHPDLSTGSRLLASADFVGDGTNLADPCGHGTHVAGIIAGNGAASTGSQYFRTFYGIARNANLVSARVLDANGQSNVSTVLAGIQWVINNRSAYNIRVMNLSLGHPVGESYTTDPLCQAVEAAWKNGIFVVCAAGNAGRLNAVQTPGMDNEGWGTANGSIQSPANDPFVITVGAMKSMDGNRAHDQIATYSSRGPSRLDMVMKPDIVAPGNRVISLDSKGSCLDTAYGATNVVPMSAYKNTSTTVASWRYFRLSGTSMAAPVVAGAAALMLQKDPTLTPDMLKARLMISADKWTDASGSFKPCTYGAGYLNIPAALASTARISAFANSPTLSRDTQGNVVINRQFVIWGTSTIWGLDTTSTTTTTTGGTDTSGGTTSGGTGTSGGTTTTAPPPPDNIIIWGNNIIWGTDTLSASNIIWGSSVWSDNIIWGTSASSVDLSTTALLGE